MDTFVIDGGRRLAGRVRINGSKNAALPLLAATLLTDQPVRLRDVPNLADIQNMLRLLRELGCEHRDAPAEGTPWSGTVTLAATDQSKSHAKYEVVKTMRASICTLGPMLARRGYARVSLPGGCAIGERPVDLHIRGLRALGAQITINEGDIIARVPTGGLTGNTIFMGGAFGSTVLGTANVMSAATLAKGTTVIECAACEPEIVDLALLLNKMGARISGQGSPRITIEGVDELGGAEHRVIPDRIEAGTYMMAAAVTNGEIILDNCPVDTLLSALDCLTEVGVHVEASQRDANHRAAPLGPSRLRRPHAVQRPRDQRPHPPPCAGHHAASPGVSHRSAGPVDDRAEPGRRQLGHHRADFPRPLPSRRGTLPDGGQPHPPGFQRDHQRRSAAHGGAGDGQ